MRTSRLQCQESSASSVDEDAYHRADHRRSMRNTPALVGDGPVSLEYGTLTTVENAHNTADKLQHVSRREDPNLEMNFSRSMQGRCTRNTIRSHSIKFSLEVVLWTSDKQRTSFEQQSVQ